MADPRLKVTPATAIPEGVGKFGIQGDPAIRGFTSRAHAAYCCGMGILIFE